MNNSNLSFSETLSVDKFMEERDIQQLEVVRNPNTNKLFLNADGDPIGKVSTKGFGDNPSVSKCVDRETGDEFWMLHKTSQENVVASFSRN